VPSLPTSRAPANVNPPCPLCDDCGWLPNPYSGGPADYIPCPCCPASAAAWTTEDCLPLAAVESAA